jgi:hypothetical protein
MAIFLQLFYQNILFIHQTDDYGKIWEKKPAESEACYG